jgi:hypothetical protein
MAAPLLARGRFGATDLKSVSVLDDPFQGLAFLQFEGGSQRRGADQIVLAVLATALDDLEFRKVSHGPILAI